LNGILFRSQFQINEHTHTILITPITTNSATNRRDHLHINRRKHKQLYMEMGDESGIILTSLFLNTIS